MLDDKILQKCNDYLLQKIPNFIELPVYNSIDIRQASFKLSPVDNNIFPAGFNNLSSDAYKKFASICREYFVKHNINTVILVCENHTRNTGYLENVKILASILKQSGVVFDIAKTNKSPEGVINLDDEYCISHLSITLGKLGTKKIPNPDFILLNNDLSDESNNPEILQAIINTQNVHPPAQMGWHSRKKSYHFTAYSKLIAEVASYAGFDPWLVDAYFTTTQCLDFSNASELQNVADAASDIFKKVKAKYKEYKISSDIAVFLKSESGTYGLGVEKINSPNDLLNPNRTFRKNIIYGRSKNINTEFLIQEAVPTSIIHNKSTAERTLYVSFGQVFGGFYRVHSKKHIIDNLNARGAQFFPIEEELFSNEFNTLRFIARASTLATTLEADNLTKQIVQIS